MSIGENISEKDPNKEDIDWINRQLEIVREMLEFHQEISGERGFNPFDLDSLFEILLKEITENKIKAEVVASAIGCAPGECMVKQLEFRWVKYSDEYGTDLALKYDKSIWTTFPISSVWKKKIVMNLDLFQQSLNHLKERL